MLESYLEHMIHVPHWVDNQVNTDNGIPYTGPSDTHYAQDIESPHHKYSQEQLKTIIENKCL